MNSSLVPIALFVYNRPDHCVRTIQALQNNDLAPESELFLFSDAPADKGAETGVRAVRRFIHTITGFKKVTIIEREENLGLAQSIILGVSTILKESERIIVLEDDMISSPFFLSFMNKSLELYHNHDVVAAVHGYMYPVRADLPETFFLQMTDCWGWGTWGRAWKLFESDGKKLLDEIYERKLAKIFNFHNSYPFTRLLEQQISGKVDSWAIRWYASTFLRGKLGLFPGRSLIQNIGLDGSGRHADEFTNLETTLTSREIYLDEVLQQESEYAREQLEKYFARNLSGKKRLIRKLRKLLRV